MKKPYTFLKCDFSFLPKEELNTYITSVHEMMIPYKCLKCDFSFLQKEELNTHITSVHGMMKPYKCLKYDLRFFPKRSVEHTYYLSEWNDETLQMFEM